MDQAAAKAAPELEVRAARPEDLDWILIQLQEFSEFMQTRHKLFGDEEYARNLMLAMMTEHLLLIAEREGLGRIGLVAGFYLPHPFNPKIRNLSETFWWVSKEHRGTLAGGLAAGELLDAFIAWGQGKADQITFSKEMHSPFNERQLLKRGFRRAEQTYLMELG